MMTGSNGVALLLVSAWLTSTALSCKENQDEVPPNPVRVVGMGEPPAELGETASNGLFELRVERVKPCSVEAHFRPPPGVVKLGVEISLHAVGVEDVPANSFYALLVSEGGDRYEPTLAGCTPALKARKLARGERATGWVTFDVPESVRQATFRYAPVVIGAGRPHLEFSLGTVAGSSK